MSIEKFNIISTESAPLSFLKEKFKNLLFLGELVGFKKQTELEENLEQVELLVEETSESATPEQREKIRDIGIEIQQTVEGTLKKISNQLGSNEGGWYEDTETGQKFYVKFYKNSDQARIEFIANQIYKKLGIRAVDSHLQEIDGRLAIMSSEISGAQATNLEEQKASPEVRGGFLADAFLANWDVVGLVFDNIVKDQEGGFCRIDNGGSLTFRSQGGSKDFSRDEIPELQNMLNPNYPAGKVFEGITEEEMKAQAQKIIRNLSDEDVDQIIKDSKLEEELGTKLARTLKGRRSLLIARFVSTEAEERKRTERIPVVIEKLKEQAEKLKEIKLRPRIGILADKDKIENQQIDVIDCEDIGVYQVMFKLTQGWYDKILSKTREISTEIQSINYCPYRDKKSNNNDSFILTEAFVVKRGMAIIRVSSAKNAYGTVKSAQGLIQIEIPKTEVKNPKNIENEMVKILQEFFEAQDGLEPPGPEEEKNYKIARYQWHHNLDDIPDQEKLEILDKLKRREVFPGYFTFVDEGKNAEYKTISPFVVFHKVYQTETLVKIIKAGGLICTHERYRRGLIYSGMSSMDDLCNGGGRQCFYQNFNTKWIRES